MDAICQGVLRGGRPESVLAYLGSPATAHAVPAECAAAASQAHAQPPWWHKASGAVLGGFVPNNRAPVQVGGREPLEPLEPTSTARPCRWVEESR
jgi:hypothetical protein